MREGIALRVQELIDADTLSGRLAAWTKLIDWARSGLNAANLGADGMLSATAMRRWTLLLDFLDANPDIRAKLQECVAEIFTETEGVNLFGTVGLPSGRGFIAELGDRLVKRILPEPPDEHDLGRLLTRLYRTKQEVERFARLPPELFSRLAELLRAPGRPDLWAVAAARSRGRLPAARRAHAERGTGAEAARTRSGNARGSIAVLPAAARRRRAAARMERRRRRHVRRRSVARACRRLPPGDGGDRAPARERRRQRGHRVRARCDRSLPRAHGADDDVDGSRAGRSARRRHPHAAQHADSSGAPRPQHSRSRARQLQAASTQDRRPREQDRRALHRVDAQGIRLHLGRGSRRRTPDDVHRGGENDDRRRWSARCSSKASLRGSITLSAFCCCRRSGWCWRPSSRR